MRKGIFYILIIAVIFAMVNLISYNSKTIGILNSNAYDEDWDPPYGAGLVNSFESGGFNDPAPPSPPEGPNNDIAAWERKAPVGIPTPSMMPIGGSFTQDLFVPSGMHGINIMRITWTGKDLYSGQYMDLPSDMFENVGCGPEYQATGTYLTEEAKDWTCYDYVRFNYFMNFYANDGCSTALSQTASISDGYNTITGTALDAECQTGGGFKLHYTMSLRYLANQYDPATGRYFDISDVQKFIINAVQTDYDQWPATSQSGFPTGSSRVIMYYDYLTLGADAMPNDPVPDTQINIDREIAPAGNRYNVIMDWDFQDQTGDNPITGYHVYRSTAAQGASSADGPYIAVGLTSTALSGGRHEFTDETHAAYPVESTFCYKVLTTDNGPMPVVSLQKSNTINATYNEALLDDAAEVCIDIPPLPTATTTPTITPTYDPNAGNYTPTPTMTITPIPTVDPSADITAYVYPNPYNPHKGSGKFYLGGINDDEVDSMRIFSMDGALVYEKTDAPFEWAGKNQNNSPVVSGLYYLVLKTTGGRTKVYRVMVCYGCEFES